MLQERLSLWVKHRVKSKNSCCKVIIYGLSLVETDSDCINTLLITAMKLVLSLDMRQFRDIFSVCNYRQHYNSIITELLGNFLSDV